MIFWDGGRAYWLKVHEIPDVGPGGKGKAIANLVAMEDGERIAALLAVREWPSEDDRFHVLMGTGRAIRSPEADVRSMGRTAYGVRGITLRDDDEVVALEVVRPGDTLLTVTE